MRWILGARADGLDPNFLEWIRDFDSYMQKNYGIELVITSGYRTEEENERVGGVKGSAHTKGLAVDLAVNSGRQRYYLIRGALEFGFRRIGVGHYHVHLDMDFSKPYPTIFPDIEK